MDLRKSTDAVLRFCRNLQTRICVKTQKHEKDQIHL